MNPLQLGVPYLYPLFSGSIDKQQRVVMGRYLILNLREDSLMSDQMFLGWTYYHKSNAFI